MRDDVRRTPDERFEALPEWPYAPRYVEVDGYRLAYVDEGPRAAPPVLLLHGEPSWAFLYRRMIPVLVARGLRCVAPDLLGFGRSDKPLDVRAHRHATHVALMKALVAAIDLRDATFFGQDWGGLIGLRVVAEAPERFARLAVANTGLPDAHPWIAPFFHRAFLRRVDAKGTVDLAALRERVSFARWVAFTRTAPDFPAGAIVQWGTRTRLPDAVVAAYDAPFPDESYKAGPRALPSLVTSELGANRRAWRRVLERWERPCLTLFSDADPITRGGEAAFQRRVPGAAGRAHVTIRGAGHFLQEDAGPELAAHLADFVAAAPPG